MIDLSWISEQFFPRSTPDEINRGHCFIWAWIARITYPNATLWSAHDPDRLDGDHAFVQIGNLWFDAEHPRGVTAPKFLTFFSHMGDEQFSHEPMSDLEFKSFWGTVPEHWTPLAPWPLWLPRHQVLA